MIVKSLGQTSFTELMECFLEAFQNYFVKMPTDYDYYKKRWQAAMVDYNLSYGMFEGDKLVGFIINAIDQRDAHRIAFNTGTGVIPAYRGKKIVKEIYDYAIPDLKNHGITKCSLEVITDNVIAINSYRSIGFQKTKYYKCFNGTLKSNKRDFNLKEVNYDQIDWSTLPNQELYSWDNHRHCLSKGDYRYFQVLEDNKEIAFFVINPEINYVAQLDVLAEAESYWDILFSSIHYISETIKINNVDDRLKTKIEALENAGLENSIDQFEMELLF
ncbi:GNAT family N-acetyltransferase [Winogradskyella sp. 3972H.M.0a.05]|uniref:GNAT family N-acetyltransferase n=1 Tax=Winogradskyella sp. 3972H.M.0a.05 TaxID=2950277 RepID=UPI00339B4BA7